MSWRNVKLSEVLTHRKEFITIDDSVEYKRCRVQVNRRGVILRDNIKGFLINTKKQQVCKAGDFLVAEIDAKVGGYGFVPDELEGAIVSSHYFLFEIDETKMLKDYLALIIKTDILQEQILSKGSTNYAAIRPSHVLNFDIPLPNIDEQIKLVKRLNKVSERYLQIETEFTFQQNYLKLLRQAILQEAVQGKLTQQNKADEPADKLLQRIKTEKQKLIAVGKLKMEKELLPITKDEIPFELPKGWTWCKLKELGLITGGGTPSTGNINYWNGSIPWITPKDMKADYLNDSEDKVTIEGIKNSSAKLIAANSVLVVGRSGILKRILPVCINTVECTVNQDLKVIVPYLPIMARYIQLMLQGHQDFILKKLVKYGMTVHSLMYKEFELQIFPIPPLSEQYRIVAKVEQLMQLVNQLEKQLTQSQIQAQQLLQAILKKSITKNNSAKIIEITQSTIAPRKILAGRIIQLCNSSRYFGHTTFQKNLYLCETHAKIEVYETNYAKDRAGPFDKDFFFPFLKEMEKEEWFYEEQKGSITYFRTGEKVGKLVKDYATHFRQYNNAIRFVLQLMKDKTTDESELVATIYAVWNNYLILKKGLNNSTLIEEVYDWSSSKIKFTKTDITNTWQWMKEQNFIPHGWGKLIEKNKK